MKLVTRTEAEQEKHTLWWPVWTGGYVVEEVEEAGGVRYMGLDTDHGGSTMYYPLRKRLNVHYQFARIHTEEDAKSFAASYGLLTSGTFAEKVGELWLTQARRVRELLALHDLTHDTEAEIERYVLPVYNLPAKAWKVSFAGSDFTTAVGGLDTARDAALWVLCELLNQELKSQVSASVVPREGDVTLVHNPRNLLAMIWLRVAMEVSEMRREGICQGCGKPMWMKRSDKKVHNDKCRMRRNRKLNQAQAIAASEDG